LKNSIDILIYVTKMKAVGIRKNSIIGINFNITKSKLTKKTAYKTIVKFPKNNLN